MKLAVLLLLAGLAWAGSARAANTNSMITLFHFKAPADAAAWQIVNDDVMGGVSRSRFTVATNGPATFAGELSLANNGGFASVRSRPTLMDVSRHETFVLRVRGDGRRYKFTARTDSGFDSVLYQAAFDTKAGEWTEHHIAFAGLTPTFRGRILADAPRFDPAKLQSAGFLIADKAAGAFALEIEWIKAGTAGK